MNIKVQRVTKVNPDKRQSKRLVASGKIHKSKGKLKSFEMILGEVLRK
jgi:hypothetical protein